MNNTIPSKRLISIAQGEIFVEQWQPEQTEGNSTDIPLILLHDSLGSVAQWKSFPKLLANTLQRRVIAYDRLGFGQSSSLTELPSMNFIEEEATDIFPKIKRALNINKFSVLGHSVGGGMAAYIAANDNDCQHLVTIAAQAYVENQTISGILAAKKYFEDTKQLARLAKWHGDKTAWVLSAWVDTWTASEFADFSLCSILPKITCPTLVIHGENDEYGSIDFPNTIAKLVSGITDKVILANCAHVPHKEQSETVIELINSFIVKNEASTHHIMES